MKKVTVNLMFTFLFVLLMPASAVSIHSSHLQTSDGMHQTTVFSIYQDEFGIMWFGTKNGLVRYDGNKTEYVDKLYKDVTSAENLIRGICGDKKGKMYLNTRSGIIEFDIRSNKFTQIIDYANAINYGNSNLWICKKNSIYKWKDHQLKKYFSLPETNAIIDCIIETPQKDLCVGTNQHGIYLIKKDMTLRNILPHIKQIRQLFLDSERNIWISTRGNGLFRLDRRNNIKNYLNVPNNAESISSNIIRAICEDNSGNLWFATFKGLNKYQRNEDKFIHYEYQNDNYSNPYDGSIYCLTKDQQGTIWSGSFIGGINYFNPEYETFIYHTLPYQNSISTSNLIFGKTVEDKNGNLWMCAERGGVFQYNVINKTLKPCPINDKPFNAQTLYLDNKDNLLWVGTLLYGIKKFDLTNKTVKTLNKKLLINNNIYGIIPYKNELILATQRGIGLFDIKNGTCSYLLPSDENKLNEEPITGIMLDRKERLWFSTHNKLFRYDIQKKKIEKIRLDNQGNGNYYINKIYESSNGNIWIGTVRHGLYLNIKGEKNFTCINTENGLINNFVIDISEDRKGNILIVTGNGLSCIKTGKNEIVNINKNKFIPAFFITDNSLYITRNDQVFIGGQNIICEFPFNKIFMQPQLYTVNISNLVINGKKIEVGVDNHILKESLLFCNEITLSHKENSFSIEAFTNNYASALKCGIRYKLEGFDKDWKHANVLNEITYTNLFPGEYKLRIQGETKLPSGSFPERVLEIKIQAPFYQTTLAYIIYLLLALLILYEIYQILVLRSSLKFEKEQKKQIEKLNQAKLRFFTNISHEFKTPLTLIFSQVELMLKSKSLPPKLYNQLLCIWRNATRMNRLIVELLEFRKQEQGFVKLRVNRYNIVQLINEVCFSFKDYAETRKIKLLISANEEDISFCFDYQQMEKVLFNLMSNAFKFTPDEGNITVRVEQNGNNIIIDIEDTGIGINQDELTKIFDRFYQAENTNYANKFGTGIGLAFAKNIITAHQGTITVKSRKEEGSCFTIKLPLDVEYQQDQIQTKATPIEYGLDDMNETGNIPDNLFINELIEQQKDANTRNSTVLIVEDNEDVRNLLVSVFEQLYFVLTAGNGKEGYEKAIEKKPDIILSDVVMPEMNGTELCQKIKANIETSHIPVILLTSQASSEYVIEGLKIGADDYITKPFSIKQLIIRCNNLVNSRKTLKAKFAKEINTSIDLIATTSLDQSIIEESIRIINENLGNPLFSIDFLSQHLGIGRTNFYSKIKAITGLTPNEFIINSKLKIAIKILKENNNISTNDLAFKLGFSSTSYFIKLFKDLAGMTPSQYKRKIA